MAWTPTAKVIDLTQLADNLLGYIETNQTSALGWAYGGPGLVDFQKFYTNATGRLQTIFPSLLILTQTVGTDLDSDALVGAWELVLEAAISGGDTDELVANTKYYAKALESMLTNMPTETITAGSSQPIKAVLAQLETRFDQTRRIKASSWIQIFQTRCAFTLHTSGY